jgi:hypothetical protein
MIWIEKHQKTPLQQLGFQGKYKLSVFLDKLSVFFRKGDVLLRNLFKILKVLKILKILKKILKRV